MIIRRVEMNDLDMLADLWLKMTKEFEPQNAPNIIWWKEQHYFLMNLDTYFQFVAEQDGQLIGMVDFMLLQEPSDGKIHAIGQQLYVLPEYRKTSIAGRLWKTASKAAKKTAQVWDTTAYSETKSFWEKRGFKFYCYTLRKEVQLCR